MPCGNSSLLPKDNRIFNIAFELYDDSMNPNWREFLEEMHVSYIAIYHDKDINPNGEKKKNHYHVILCFEAKKSLAFFDNLALGCGAANDVWLYVLSLRQMARYLCHLDNPEKYQYPLSDVRSYGVDYDNLISVSSDRYNIVGDIIDFCEDNNVTSFAYLLTYARYNRREWFKSLCDNCSFVIREYLRSKYEFQKNFEE